MQIVIELQCRYGEKYIQTHPFQTFNFINWNRKCKDAHVNLNMDLKIGFKFCIKSYNCTFMT